jgi:hypothetical protein
VVEVVRVSDGAAADLRLDLHGLSVRPAIRPVNAVETLWRDDITDWRDLGSMRSPQLSVRRRRPFR